MKKKPKIRSMGIQVIALLFLANLGGSYYWVKTRTMAASCIDRASISTDSRCLYILTGKVFEMGSRKSPHRGHPCGMDVTSILPSNHSAKVSKYLDPRYRADLCTASAPTNTPKPTNTSAPLATNTPVPTNTVTPMPTNTPKPTIPGAPLNTATPMPTNTATPNPTNTPRPTNTPMPTLTPTPVIVGATTIPTITEVLAEATPTSSVIAVADECTNTDLNNDGLINSIDRIICLQNQVTPTIPEPTIVQEIVALEPTIVQEIVTPIPTSAPEKEEPSIETFADLGFAAWWGLVLTMASAGTLASTLLLGMLRTMSNTIAANLSTGKYKMTVAPTENNLVVSRGDIAEKLFYVTPFGVIDDNTCWVNLSGNEGLVLGKLSQPKIIEGFYKVSGYTVTSAANPYIAIEKITPLEKNG